jgi:AAA15 family ATPase/GTPase
MDGLIQTNKEMKYTLKKALIVNDHKTLQPGQTMDVTDTYAKWLDDNGYGTEEKKKENKTKKTKKAQEEQK